MRTWTLGLVFLLVAGCSGSSPHVAGCSDPLMLDDLEDGDRAICESAGRHGSWYVLGDGTSTTLSPKGDFTPTAIPGGRDGSRYAARMTGSGFSYWGAQMGVYLNSDGAEAAAYDARAIQGVKFWMKSDVPVYVTFPMPETIAAGQPGGTCVDADDQYNCDNPFLFPITAPSPTGWTEYTVPFSAGTQYWAFYGAGGDIISGSATWDPSRVVEVDFLVDPGQAFDVWIDDLRAYSCTGAECAPTCADPKFPVSCPAGDGVAAGCWKVGTDCAKLLPFLLRGVWGSGPDDVWGAGWWLDGNGNQSAGVIIHWDGARWSPVEPGTEAPLYGLWGRAADDIWAVGGHGAIVHWDGIGWSPVASGTDGVLLRVWGSGPNDVWAVGFDNTILHWDGATWVTVQSEPGGTLTGVWAAGPANAWIVGYLGDANSTALGGVALHWDGASWSSVDLGANVNALYGVWGSGPNDVWAVGIRGRIAHWDGTSWSSATTGGGGVLNAVWGSGKDDVWAAGSEGTLRHWNGLAWSTASGGPDLVGVWGSGPNDVWAVGTWGTILHGDGTTWTGATTQGIRP